MVTITLVVYSPKYSIEEEYLFNFDRSALEIKTPQLDVLKMVWRDYSDPEWLNKNSRGLFDIMANDLIYPPKIIEDLFIYAWKQWRNGDLSDKQLDTEMQHIADWINETTKHMPRSDFWSTYL